jgi:hypothetical protein
MVVVEEPAVEVLIAERGLDRGEVHPDQYAPVPLSPCFLALIFGIRVLRERYGGKILIPEILWGRSLE